MKKESLKAALLKRRRQASELRLGMAGYAPKMGRLSKLAGYTQGENRGPQSYRSFSPGFSLPYSEV